jgi:hypothetical protein
MKCTFSNFINIADNNTKTKPEAAAAVIELLMMGGKMPETV